ncbi:MAG: CPBP family intramembrane glutamic endopeptidase [Pirellulaceae bacterium]|nr:CPBP family intramembrane glutamic endopeptidase [Pirellulaceae bacterium]
MDDRATNDSSPTPWQNLGLALLVEGGLGGVAIGVGWLLGFWPAIGMGWRSPAAGEQLLAAAWGLAATAPLFAVLLVMDRFPVPRLAQVRNLAVRATRELFPQARWWQFALVSLAAGMGEELIFRGLLQAGLETWIGPPAGAWIGLVVAALVFGAFHWLNATYALLATLAGLYFGGLLLASDSLWTPIVAHAAYDFVALCYLSRGERV